MKPYIYRANVKGRWRWLVRWDSESSPENITPACWWAIDHA